jgi:prevent-host-death family protein
MKKARIAELKNRLSHYLRYVRRGQPVVVYDRDRAIARIEPIADPRALEGAGWLAEVERSGAVRAPSAPLPAGWLQRRIPVKADVTGALLDERHTGR